MRAMVIASNSSFTRFLAQAENEGILFFETQESIQLLRGNQVKGEFYEIGRTVFTNSGGIVFGVDIIKFNGSLPEGLEWLGFINPDTIAGLDQ